MDALTFAEVLIGGLVLCVVLILVYVYWRRRRIARGGSMMPCAVRQPGGPWRLGLIRLTTDSLDWFSIVGPSLRPEFSWRRPELDLSSATEVRGHIPGLNGAVEVSGRYGDSERALAMERGNYLAVRAWLESSPPGHNVNVA